MDKNELEDLRKFIVWISTQLADYENYDEEIKPDLQRLLDLVKEKINE
tara:strand:- start:577 stop:720 length:144 start_codon:yes stop_codon:yes gene_type:complete